MTLLCHWCRLERSFVLGRGLSIGINRQRLHHVTAVSLVPPRTVFCSRARPANRNQQTTSSPDDGCVTGANKKIQKWTRIKCRPERTCRRSPTPITNQQLPSHYSSVMMERGQCFLFFCFLLSLYYFVLIEQVLKQ